MILRISTALLLACLPFTFSCKRQSLPPATVVINTGSSAIKNSTAWYTLDGNDIATVVWFDSTGHTSRSAPDDYGRLDFFPPDRMAVSLSFDRNEMKINGKPYSLANGGIFLVYAMEVPARVVQLSRHVPIANSPTQALINASHDDPDIRRFIESAGATTAPTTGTSSIGK